MEMVLVDYDIRQITKKDSGLKLGHGPQGLTPQHYPLPKIASRDLVSFQERQTKLLSLLCPVSIFVFHPFQICLFQIIQPAWDVDGLSEILDRAKTEVQGRRRVRFSGVRTMEVFDGILCM